MRQKTILNICVFFFVVFMLAAMIVPRMIVDFNLCRLIILSIIIVAMICLLFVNSKERALMTLTSEADKYFAKWERRQNEKS